MEIPNVWRCEACKYQGLKETFADPIATTCPKCQSEDVFPTRWFRCNTCGHEAEEDDFFAHEIDLPKDDHPIRVWDAKAKCPNEKCPNFQQDVYDEEKFVEVTEIPVPGFTAA
jgi:hypothetical protein